MSRHRVAENLLQAFQLTFPEETIEQRSLRQEAYSQCWTALSQQLEVNLLHWS